MCAGHWTPEVHAGGKQCVPAIGPLRSMQGGGGGGGGEAVCGIPRIVCLGRGRLYAKIDGVQSMFDSHLLVHKNPPPPPPPSLAIGPLRSMQGGSSVYRHWTPEVHAGGGGGGGGSSVWYP